MIQYFDLDPLYKRKLYKEYMNPLKLKIVLMLLGMSMLFFLVINGATAGKTDDDVIDVVSIRSLSSDSLPVNWFKYTIIGTFLFFGLIMLTIFTKSNIGVYKDYLMGKGVIEQVQIIEVIYTPARPIYKVNSEVFLTVNIDAVLYPSQPLELVYLRHSQRLIEVRIL